MPVGERYHEVINPERIVFTTGCVFQRGRDSSVEERKTVDFIEQNGKTKLVLNIKVTKCGPAFIEALTGWNPGWNQSLARMEKQLIKNSS